MELLTIAFIFGMLIGSFLNVIILRIPNDESIVFGGSHCTTCGHNLKPWHNVPLFSWLFLRGKCSFCGAKISIQYPLIELTSGLIFLMLVNKFGFSVPVLFIALSFFMLLSLSMIDLKYKMVPDSLNLLALLFAIVGAWSLHGVLTNFQNALLFAGGFTLLRFALSYYLTSSAHRDAKKTITPWTKNYHTYPFIEAMGEGDIMVGATMGALLGVKLTLVAVFLSAILALPVMIFLINRYGQGQTVPFVPFLVLATFIVYIFDSYVLTLVEALY
ncbi:prepilin peptidase [Candidatus Sulfurimonas marisnigri]|uniref:Prepilin peptidase n=1 Tax=Candidatus Sulfurimonas marisnigri TaxID=2740405 RepID=A0A7S7M296_9BACT|nr:A24 family peptidase [Candidatus Sulfurimonas marisnigri]QOY55747.1 prepilin peptidase [Candidatus Sulfurimonas marisnigri]